MKSTFQKPDATYPHGSLREQPKMKEPNKNDFYISYGINDFVFNAEVYVDACKEYEKEKAACLIIPCSENNWKDGQELEEGKDYGIVAGFKDKPAYAVPIVRETEDELWDDVIGIFSEMTSNPFGSLKSLEEVLKSKFTIQRRKQ